MNDKKLVRIFSQYIRLRDTDARGIGTCITCPRRVYYSDAHCGHGIPRANMATKFDERNNNLQCRSCNIFKGGKEKEYAEAVDVRFGPGTWDELKALARKVCSFGQSEIDELVKTYTAKANELRLTKQRLL